MLSERGGARRKGTANGPARGDAPPARAWRVAPPPIASPRSGDAPDGPLLRRRRLLRAGFWAGVSVLAAGAVAAAADFLNPPAVQPVNSVVTVPAAKVPKPGADPYHDLDHRFWLVNLKPGEGQQLFGAGLPDLDSLPRPKGGLLALSDSCPLHGCRVPWRPDFEFGGAIGWFRCPCCASTFTKGGVLAFGIAPRSLDTMPILRVSSRGVAVETSRTRLRRGASDDPLRAVPAGRFGSGAGPDVGAGG